MSDFSGVEKFQFEKLLGMQSGYILDLSNRIFQEFMFEHAELDIYDEKYNYSSGSKANRLRAFWNEADNYTIGKVNAALLERWKVIKSDTESEITQSEQTLFDKCYQIANKLVQTGTSGEELDEVEITVHFNQIQQSIIEQINLAQFTIWVAVAWFTDKILFGCLVAKKNQGVNVQVIIIDDEINRNSGLPYEKYFETYRIKKTEKYENIMHNKFCVIDLKTVIHGSYNWTKRAQFNNETISTIANKRKTAEEFAEQFIKLKSYGRS